MQSIRVYTYLFYLPLHANLLSVIQATREAVVLQMIESRQMLSKYYISVWSKSQAKFIRRRGKLKFAPKSTTYSAHRIPGSSDPLKFSGFLSTASPTQRREANSFPQEQSSNSFYPFWTNDYPTNGRNMMQQALGVANMHLSTESGQLGSRPPINPTASSVQALLGPGKREGSIYSHHSADWSDEASSDASSSLGIALANKSAMLERLMQYFHSAFTSCPSARSGNSTTRAQCSSTINTSASERGPTASIGDSTATLNSIPSLTNEPSSSSSPSPVSTVEGIMELPTHIPMLNQPTTEDDVPEIAMNSPTQTLFNRPTRKPLECLLWWLNNCGCEGYTTWNEKELYHHTVNHHLSSKELCRAFFPQRVTCPLPDCQKPFSTNELGSDQAWKALIKHMAKHHRDGRTLHGSLMDDDLLKFLWSARLINKSQYQDIAQNGQLTQPFTHYVEYHDEERRRQRNICRRVARPSSRNVSSSINGSPVLDGSSPGSGSQDNSHPGSGRSSQPTQKTIPQQPHRSKRRRDHDEDEDGMNSKRQLVGQDGADEAPQMLACPFFKRNPRKYNRWKFCPGPGWLTTHRMK
jgi:hypothetical protein